MGRGLWSTRNIVEDCLILSISNLKRDGFIKNDMLYEYPMNGYTVWKNSYGEKLSTIGFSIRTEDNRGNIKLDYAQTDRQGNVTEKIAYDIGLTTTVCNFGGRRWWFACACHSNNVYCGRRVGKLYKPKNSKYFACRHCYNLTYKSCRENHMYDKFGLFSNLTPSRCNRILKGLKL